MNRGNLAEDPKSGLPSSSRYSRDGGERNSLLYVDSSTLRKERRDAQRTAGNQGSTVKGNHNSRKNRSVGRGLTDSHMDRLEVGSDGRLFQVKEKGTPSASRQNTSAQKASEQIISKQKSSGQTVSEKPISGHRSSGQTVSEKPISGHRSSGQTVFEKPISGQKSSGQTVSEKSISAQPSVNEIRPAITQGVVSDTCETAPEQGQRAKLERSYLTQSNPLLSGSRTGRGALALSVKVEAGKADFAENRVSAPSAVTAVKGFFHRFRVPIIAGIVTAASIGYGFTAWHYRNRFYPGTEFFGIPAAEMSVYDIKALVKAKVDSYSLELVARKPLQDEAVRSRAAASENVITAEDVAMVYRDNGEIDNAMKNQKVWAWPVMMLAQMIGHGDSALKTTYDRHLVTEAVENLPCMQKENMIAPEDAKVILTDDGASVQTEIYGTTLDKEKTEEAVRTALNMGSTRIDLDDLGLYRNPKVYSSDLSLMADAMAMNKVLGAKVLLRFGNRTEVINSKVISKMLDKKGSSYELNEEKLRACVTDLAGKYDTLQKERSFFTSIGTKITLEAGMGDYGWQLDQEATFEKLLEAIRDQKKTTISPVFTQEAYCSDANDIGDTYVEISLTNQTMWFYKNGKLVVETPVVTGNPYAGHETPSGGVWSLKGRMRNQTLSGQGYTSPVDYWMPFNGGVGIHDMQSRAWFGGSIYLGSGSHGCINTPLAAVKLIYSQIEDGVPVIVYKDESEEALSLVTGPTDAQTLNAQIEETYGTVEDDGIGSIVAWSRSQRAQAATAAAASAGTTAS